MGALLVFAMLTGTDPLAPPDDSIYLLDEPEPPAATLTLSPEDLERLKEDTDRQFDLIFGQ